MSESSLGLSDRVRRYLEVIAGRVPDGDEVTSDPWIATVGMVYLGAEDAEALCLCVELADAVERWQQVFGRAAADQFLRALILLVRVVSDYEHKYGAEAGERMLRNLVRLMGETATVETVDLTNRTENA